MLHKALNIEMRLPNARQPADTHVNLCVVLHALGRPGPAKQHAKAALVLLQLELNWKERCLSPDSGIPEDRLNVLAVCFHNLGVTQVKCPSPL